jgi:hypothetical protein
MLLGPSDWQLAGMSEAEQVHRISQVYPVHNALQTIRLLAFSGFRDDEAFAIEGPDESARTYLREALLRRHALRDRLRESLAWLIGYALFQREGFAEVLMTTSDDKRLVFKGLQLRSPRAVRREGDNYVYEPAKEFGPTTTATGRIIGREHMIDVRRDLPVADDTTVRGVLGAYWEDQIISHETLATAEAAARPEARGLRWDFARIRRPRVSQRSSLHARITYLLNDSLIGRALYFSEPGFTREFLLWQHHHAISRIAEIRETTIRLLNERVVEPLLTSNATPGGAHLVAAKLLTQHELDEAYESARSSSMVPYEFYKATTPSAR